MNVLYLLIIISSNWFHSIPRATGFHFFYSKTSKGHIMSRFSTSISESIPSTSSSSLEWIEEASYHANAMDDLLYPKVLRVNSKNKGDQIKFKARTHAVPTHPIYNFLHSYYRYSPQELRLYSPGLGKTLNAIVPLRDQQQQQQHEMMSKYIDVTKMKYEPSTQSFSMDPHKVPSTSKRYGRVAATTSRDILFATMLRPPHFGCFGLHEWAMLYSNHTTDENIDPSQRHQAQLQLRVSQAVIDRTVEQSGLSCTHFDAWRFFHAAAQPLNSNNPMTRAGQVQHEQPGCIHATMDLFKYAYQLYPFVSSDLLRRCLSVAVEARKIDMRASPYNVSHVEGCEVPICVETTDGKMMYVDEQKKLYDMSFSLRKELYDVYCDYLTYLQ